jgi:hypothetical protein
MQERRRNQVVQQLDPTKEKILVPPQYWEDLEKKDMAELCENAPAGALSPEEIVLAVLGRQILVDRKNRSLRQKSQGEWKPVIHPLLELLVLVYLLECTTETPEPRTGERPRSLRPPIFSRALTN